MRANGPDSAQAHGRAAEANALSAGRRRIGAGTREIRRTLIGGDNMRRSDTVAAQGPVRGTHAGRSPPFAEAT